MHWIEKLKVGDEVAWGRGWARIIGSGKIAKVTATRVTIQGNGLAFLRSTGKQHGGGLHLYEITDDVRAFLKRAAWRSTVERVLDRKDWSKATDEQLDGIIGVLGLGPLKREGAQADAALREHERSLAIKACRAKVTAALDEAAKEMLRP